MSSQTDTESTVPADEEAVTEKPESEESSSSDEKASSSEDEDDKKSKKSKKHKSSDDSDQDTNDSRTGIEITLRNLTLSVDLKRSLKDRIRFKPAQKRELLKDVSLTLRKGRFIAIMGPSGAGKTTLLSVLSDRVRNGKGTYISGKVTINGQKRELLDNFKQTIGFVMQDDVMLSNLTPKEQLKFSACLRLDRSIPYHDKCNKADSLLHTLLLTKCANTKVGAAGVIRGVSGGERKRTSIGMELVTDPLLLFLDEPTSGLDSTTSLTVTRILKNLTIEQGTTVITTIHQPSSEIFYTFDDLILLSEGHVVYAGTVKNVLQYFSSIDLPCPKFTNPADFILDVASITWRGRAAFKKKMKGEEIDENLNKINENEQELADLNKLEYENDIQNMLAARKEQVEAEFGEEEEETLTEEQLKSKNKKRGKFRKAVRNKINAKTEHRQFEINKENEKIFESKTPLKPTTQFFYLMWRQAFQTYRDPKTTYVKLILVIIQSVLIGLIFLQLGNDQNSVNNRLGAIFLMLMNQFFANGQGSLTGFPSERPLFLREYSSRVYSTFVYYLSKSLIDLPDLFIFPIIFGSITYWMMNLNNAPDRFFIWLAFIIILANVGQSFGFTLSASLSLEQALPLMPLITIPLAVLGGFFLNSGNTPPWVIWVQYISPFFWMFQALVKNEFDGRTIECGPEDEVEDPNNPGMMKCRLANGDDVLQELDFGDATIWRSFLVLFGMWLFLRIMSFLLLLKTARKSNANT